MNAPIRAVEFFVRTWPPEARLGALISGNFDDSRSLDDLWVVAGWAGYANQWDHFETLWRAALAKHDVPYFHMREMAKPNGAFKKWLPPEEHETEVINFFKDLVGAISKCNLRKISSAVWLGDLERFNTENCLALEPYPLATYSCLVRLSQEYDELPMTVIFDHVEKVDDKLRKARAYIDSDVKFRPLGGLCNNIAANPLQKCLTSRDVPALQAADFIAWEMRKALLQMKPWQSLPDRPLNDREAQWNHYLEWTRQTTGRNPLLRKSLDALLAKNKSASIVWDRHQLETTNEFRRGIWTLEGRRVTVSNALSAPSSVSLPGAR